MINSALQVGRLDAKTTAAILGFQEHDIPILVARGLLKPLGSPAKNAKKYFSAVEILALAADTNWLSKATKAVNCHWQTQNAKRTRVQTKLQEACL